MSHLYEDMMFNLQSKIITKKHTYHPDEIKNQVNYTSNILSSLGLKKGDRLALRLSKSEYVIFFYLACLKNGYIFLPLNPDYKNEELSYFFENAAPTIIICEADEVQNISSIKASENCLIKTVDHYGKGSFYETAKKTDMHQSEVALDTDIAAIIYTSGTTGNPKGAMLSHQALLSNAKALIECWHLSSQDILLHALPLFHVHGLFFAMNTSLLTGIDIILLPKFDLDAFFTYLPSVTLFMGVPTHYTRLLNDPRLTEINCKNMRLFVSGSAPLLPAAFSLFAERTKHTILERYGMTETGINASNPYHKERKVGSVGLPIPGVELRIVDDNDSPLSYDHIGNIQVKGMHLFSGYWQDEMKTKSEFTPDGYFKTGDLGMIDSNGYVSIIGRSKDMIISGGLNVYPKEIELTIDAMPEVVESAVIGLPHPDLGEAVVAIVVSRGSLPTEQILSTLKMHHAAYKCPKKIFFVDDLPKNTMGKVEKNKLRQQFHLS